MQKNGIWKSWLFRGFLLKSLIFCSHNISKHQPEITEQFGKISTHILIPYFSIYHQVIGDRD